jgi:hypothetical protein
MWVEVDLEMVWDSLITGLVVSLLSSKSSRFGGLYELLVVK